MEEEYAITQREFSQAIFEWLLKNRKIPDWVSESNSVKITVIQRIRDGSPVEVTLSDEMSK